MDVSEERFGKQLLLLFTVAVHIAATTATTVARDLLGWINNLTKLSINFSTYKKNCDCHNNCGETILPHIGLPLLVGPKLEGKKNEPVKIH